MALLTMLIAGSQRTQITRAIESGVSPVGNPLSSPAAIVLDAMTSEVFNADAEITDHPVEAEADISDHIILKPKSLQIEGVITETPMDLAASLTGLVSAAGSKLGGTLGAVAGGFAGKSLAGLLGADGESRLQDAVTELLAARDAKKPVEIVTGLRKYPSEPGSYYLLKKVQIKRDQKTGGSINVSLEFREVIKVQSLLVKIAIPKIAQAAKKVSTGQQAAGAVAGASQKGRGASVLYGLFGG